MHVAVTVVLNWSRIIALQLDLEGKGGGRRRESLEPRGGDRGRGEEEVVRTAEAGACCLVAKEDEVEDSGCLPYHGLSLSLCLPGELPIPFSLPVGSCLLLRAPISPTAGF